MSEELDAARRDLTDALATYLDLVDDDPGYVVTEYLVVVAQQRIGYEEEIETAISVVFDSESIPLHHAIGLAEYGKARLVSALIDPCPDR